MIRKIQTLRYGAGACLIGAGVIYLVAEAATAGAWETPPYSYSFNYISDLGAPVCDTYQGRAVCSPLHGVMNAGFVVHGALFVLGAILAAASLRWLSSRLYIAFAVVHAVGVSLVGTVPETTPWPAGSLHFLGALLAIVGGNVAVIAGDRAGIRPVTPRWLPAAGVALGILGVASFAFLIARPELFPDFLSTVGDGVFERLSVYTIVAWELLAGILLLCGPGFRREAVHPPRVAE
ncbi:MAG: DUF998 domain-containing protein [Chloroflexi bacterium]|nr:DUF998 domain-containing protein [Chloroflexota bacterium]